MLNIIHGADFHLDSAFTALERSQLPQVRRA